VVGDEEERIVAVRFYATYCRVSIVWRRIMAVDSIKLYSLRVLSFVGVQSSCPAFLSNGCPIPQRRFRWCSRLTEERSLTSRPWGPEFTLCSYLPSRRRFGRRAQAHAKSHSRVSQQAWSSCERVLWLGRRSAERLNQLELRFCLPKGYLQGILDHLYLVAAIQSASLIRVIAFDPNAWSLEQSELTYHRKWILFLLDKFGPTVCSLRREV
jgi:hypothetical protein